MFTDKMLYGAAYYPEHWDRKLWARDAKLMKQAGFNIVRLAEFAWYFMEPREGQFDFSWLDEALDVLYAQGIRAILGTPTATIPAWMAKTYPHVMATHDGVKRRPFGIRKDYCVLQPDFQRLAFRVIDKMAEHYAKDKRVFGFQTDNEFSSHRCRCATCEEHFRQFLRKRYGTIDKLNKEYGAWFWGAMYNSFNEVDWPATDYPNPSHGLDLRRFSSWVDIDHQRQQVEILRKHAPGKPVTHNLMGTWSGINYYDFSKDLDFVSLDIYPGPNTAGRFSSQALSLALMCSMKDANILIMEQQSGPGGWTAYAPQTAPGETAMLAWQSIARGADGISYFRWRTCTGGQEQYWHGIINHDNKPRRRYREVAAMGKQVAALSKHIIGTKPVAEVGIYNNYDQIWATEHQIQNGDNPIKFSGVMHDFAEAMGPMGVDFGTFGDGQDISRFKAVVLPPLYLSDPKLAATLTAYARKGGHVVLTARSGVKTMNNKNLMEPLPGPFGKLAGVEVDEYSTIAKDAKYTIDLPCGHSIAVQRIREHLLPKAGTEVIGVHRGDYMTGWPAITRRKVGKGVVWYVGTLPTPKDWQELLSHILPQAGVDSRDDLPLGVEVCRRAGKGRRLTFYINHTDKPQTVNIETKAKDLLTGKTARTGQIELAPYGVAILDK